MYTNKYNCTSIEDAQKNLSQYGIAILENVLDKETCLQRETEVWDLMHSITKNLEKPIIPTNSDSYKTIYELFPSHSMLIQHWGVGQSQAVWNVRQDPRVVGVFSHLWKTKPEDLLVSFDGLSVHFPPETMKRGQYRGNDWVHTDQSQKKKGLHCIQGTVNLRNVREGDATFRFIPESHLLHEDFFKTFDVKDTGDWYKCTTEQNEWFKEIYGLETCLALAPAGSITLWDSRTFHCGSEARKDRTEPNIRMAIYVCMTPRKLSTKAQLAKKQKAFNEVRLTTHWPHRVKLFPKLPRTYGKSIGNITPITLQPNLTPLGKRLAGFD